MQPSRMQESVGEERPPVRGIKADPDRECGVGVANWNERKMHQDRVLRTWGQAPHPKEYDRIDSNESEDRGRTRCARSGVDEGEQGASLFGVNPVTGGALQEI